MLPTRTQAGTRQDQSSWGSNRREWTVKLVTQTGDASKRCNGTKVSGFPGTIDREGNGKEPCNAGADADCDPTNRERPNVRRRPLIGSPFSFHTREDGSYRGCRMDSTWSLFNRGHALPLISVRFWCPRTRRARDAECTFEIRADGRNGSRGLVLDLASARPRPRPRKYLGQSVTTESTLADPHPRPVNVQRHGMSSHSPYPRSRRGQSAYIPWAFPVRELTSAAACPRPHRGIVISVSSPRSRHHIRQTRSPYVPI